MKRLICRLLGHDKGPWFRTVENACAQHHFSDGRQCYSCGDLLGVYNENDDLVPVPPGTKAPEPVYRFQREGERDA